MRNSSKTIIISFLTFILIISLGLYVKYYLNKTTSMFIGDIKKIEYSIENNKWTEAEGLINSLDDKWSKTEKVWSLFTDHKEIDNITISVESSKEFIRSRDLPQSRASIKILQHYLNHIQKMEDLNFQNIF